MFRKRSSVRKGGHPFVRRIDNLFRTRSSVYLRNHFVDIYGTTFWRSYYLRILGNNQYPLVGTVPTGENA